jgi:hypothetical protein
MLSTVIFCAGIFDDADTFSALYFARVYLTMPICSARLYLARIHSVRIHLTQIHLTKRTMFGADILSAVIFGADKRSPLITMHMRYIIRK